MKITIIGRKVTLRDNFKELATRKLMRFDRIFDEDAEANVTVTVERNRQTVEITIRQPGMICRAEETAAEMNDALDKVISALGRQIRKNKTRLESGSIAAAPSTSMYRSTRRTPSRWTRIPGSMRWSRPSASM